MIQIQFHYRKLAAADLPLLQYVGRASYEPYYRHVWKPGGMEWYMEKCFGTAALTGEFADPNIGYYLVSDAAGEPAGFLKLLLEQPLPDGTVKNALYLEKIYLLPAFFQKGAGQELIRWTLDLARQLGREAVWLQVMRTGPVRAYERAGFVNTGPTRFEFDLLKEEERDGWVMVKRT